MTTENSPKPFFTKIQKKYAARIFHPKTQFTAYDCKTHFSTSGFPTLSWKNEKWTFLKMSKSAKISRELGLEKHTFLENHLTTH